METLPLETLAAEPLELLDLWLPILVSAVFVFIASSVIHMVLQWHNADYAKLPGEDAIMEVMRAQGVSPGDYGLPGCHSMRELAEEEMQARFEAGPVGFLTVLPNGIPAMGKNLVLWFLLSVVIGIFVAYLATRTLDPSSEYLEVFRVTGVAAILGYAGYVPTDSIWKGRRWGSTIKHLIGGVIYGLVTAGAFGWLWPSP